MAAGGENGRAFGVNGSSFNGLGRLPNGVLGELSSGIQITPIRVGNLAATRVDTMGRAVVVPSSEVPNLGGPFEIARQVQEGRTDLLEPAAQPASPLVNVYKGK